MLLELPEDIQAFLERKRKFFYVLSQNFITLPHVQFSHQYYHLGPMTLSIALEEGMSQLLTPI